MFRRLANDEEISPHRLRAYIKGSQADSNLLLLAQRDIRDTQSAAICRRARQKLPGTVAQKGGIVRVDEVRRNHINRTRLELERLDARSKREEVAKEKKNPGSW